MAVRSVASRQPRGDALLLDGAMLFLAVRFLILRNRPSARALFFTSIFFLPLILGLMVFTKV